MGKLPLKVFLIRSFVLSFCILLATPNSVAQSDTLYVRKYNHPLSLKVYLIEKFTALEKRFDNDKELLYRPNAPYGIGGGFSYKNISLSGAIGFDFMRDKKKGKTKSTDFQYHHYARKYTVDFFFQKYKRLYSEDEKTNELTFYPDVELEQYGVFVQYVFNGNKFSYKAAFNQSEYQVRSAGSFLFGVGVYYNKAHSDSSLVFIDNTHSRENVQLGVSGGYAYTWVINRHFFLSGSMSVGANFGMESLDRFGKERLRVYPALFPRVSLGYTINDWSISFSGLTNKVFIDFSDKVSSSLDTGSLQLSVTRRFSLLPSFMRGKKK